MKRITATAAAIVFLPMVLTHPAPRSAETIRPTKTIEVSGPVFPFESHGDLWFTTWAEDDAVFVSWGDGRGPEYGGPEDPTHLVCRRRIERFI